MHLRLAYLPLWDSNPQDADEKYRRLTDEPPGKATLGGDFFQTNKHGGLLNQRQLKLDGPRTQGEILDF